MRKKSLTKGEGRIGASGPVCSDLNLGFQIQTTGFGMVDSEWMDDNGDVWKVGEWGLLIIGSIQLPQQYIRWSVKIKGYVIDLDISVIAVISWCTTVVHIHQLS